MAAPPPYTPPDARWQARQMRAETRAQRQQWRAQAQAQKEYYRQYWRGSRRPSFVGPIVLLAVGILALLMEIGQLDPVTFWGWYAHWWPVLLIALGGLLLAEHFLDWHRPWAGRRPFGGIFWLVVLLVVLGIAAHAGRYIGHWQFSGDDDQFFSWMGPEHDNDVQIDQALETARPSVSISNPRGDLTITTSDDGRMHVRAHEMVHRDSDREAQKVFAELKPAVETSAQGAVVTVPQRDGARVDLTVELPAASFATVTAGHGDVTADGLKGGMEVSDNGGEVKLEDIGGDAQGHMNHGDFAAHNVQGRVLVDGHGDDVTLSQIRGTVTINGDFFGDIHLEQIASDIHYHSSMTTLDIPHLIGSLTLDKSDLSISQASGPIRVAAKSKDIDLTQIAGDAQIEDSNGDVNLVAVAPLGNLQITAHTGDVIVTLPENASFTVTGSTSTDEAVRTDFPLKMSTQGDRQMLNGTIGQGGVRLELDTDHGNLELRKGDSASLAVSPPSPPAPPGRPKHFRAPAEPEPVEQE